MTDIIFYKEYRLVRDCMGFWYCESFKESYKKLSEIKKHIDKL